MLPDNFLGERGLLARERGDWGAADIRPGLFGSNGTTPPSPAACSSGGDEGGVGISNGDGFCFGIP
jgi:hypothetical protein